MPILETRRVDDTPPTTLSPLPPPPVDRSGGYRWAIGGVAVGWVGAMAVTGWLWFTLPGFPLMGSVVWWLVGSLVVTTPGFLLLGLIACIGVDLIRRAGARRWPPALQALPVVLTVYWATFSLFWWLWTSNTTGS